MTLRALLASDYGVGLERTSVIPHGVPDWDHLADRHRVDRTTMLTQLKVPPRQPQEVGFAVAYLMSGATKRVTGMALRLTGRIVDTDLRIVQEGSSPLGPFARVEPATVN